ncbi:MAG: hypothetical protein LH461_04875 [Spirochaetaceae bacterium]|nr:hypothetical protein [Spirochaetaceae bacterium]
MPGSRPIWDRRTISRAGTFARYDLDAEQIAALRDQFADWPRDSDLDELAREAYALAHQPDDLT